MYINKDNAQDALNSGQGNKLYKKSITYNDLIYCTQGSGEFFYSPKNLRNFCGDGLDDFWYKVHDKNKPSEESHGETTEFDLKDKTISLINQYDNTNSGWLSFEKEYYNLCSKHNVNPFDIEIDELWYELKGDD